jgi:glycosyltransferase involved in cell wall biosynthesis
MSLTTFIIPTIGRDSLSRTIDSLVAQQDPDFKCIIVYDVQDKYYIPPDDRFVSILMDMQLGVHEGDAPGQSYAGAVRNKGIDLVTTPWISFVDDDDTITPDYVSRLREVQENDVVIFRMQHPSLGILPPFICNEIINGQVGISFSVRKSVLDKYNLRFVNGGIEDYDLLMALQFYKAKIYFSPHVTYKVRH